MTPERIRILKQSFNQLLPDADLAADTFLAHLFKIAPDLRQQFAGDPDRQRRELIVTAAFVVRHFGDFDEVLPMLYALGIRFRHIGCDMTGHAPARAAMVHMLEVLLGENCTPATRDAWTVCFDAFMDSAQRAFAGTAIAA